MAWYELWYWVRAGQRLGPFSPAALRRMAAAGVLRPDDPVARVPGDGRWTTAGAAPGLVEAFAATDRPDAPDGSVGCGGCGARLSPEARACPGCGHPQPVGEWADHRYRVGRCVYCLATNAVVTRDGQFFGGHCRGCGRPLEACHPQESFERDVDAVYEPAAWVGAAGLVLVGATLFVLVTWLVAAVFGREVLVVGWLAGLAAAAWGGMAARVRGRRWYGAWLRGRGAGSVEFTPDDWALAGDRYDGYREERTRERQARAGAGRGRPWWVAPAVVLALVAGCYAYHAEFSDYARGRKAGVRHVREVSMKGPFLRAGMNAANLIDLLPTDPNASPDWNAGFRAGFKEELARMYPGAWK